MYKRQVHNQPVRRNLRKDIPKWKIPKIERTHNKTVCNTLRKSIRKLNTPEIDMHNQRSVIASMMDIPLTYLLYKQNDEVIEVGLKTSENCTADKFKNKIVARKWSRTEIILKTIAVRTTGVTHVIMDHG